MFNQSTVAPILYGEHWAIQQYRTTHFTRNWVYPLLCTFFLGRDGWKGLYSLGEAVKDRPSLKDDDTGDFMDHRTPADWSKEVDHHSDSITLRAAGRPTGSSRLLGKIIQDWAIYNKSLASFARSVFYITLQPLGLSIDLANDKLTFMHTHTETRRHPFAWDIG